MNFLILLKLFICFAITYGIDIPPGLRPAKAVGESEKLINQSDNKIVLKVFFFIKIKKLLKTFFFSFLL